MLLFKRVYGFPTQNYLNYNNDNDYNLHNSYNSRSGKSGERVSFLEPAPSEPLCGDEGFSNAASMYSDTPMLSRRKST
jgi:hypothetical protein